MKQVTQFFLEGESPALIFRCFTEEDGPTINNEDRKQKKKKKMLKFIKFCNFFEL